MSKQRSAEDLIFGKWPDFLIAKGMDPAFFSGRAGPCPFCGGNDRYRWNAKKYGGVWCCRGCTDSKYANGFRMYMEHANCDFREAADAIREYFNTPGSSEPITREQRAAMTDEWTPEKVQESQYKMQRLVDAAYEVRPGDPVWLYLMNRVKGINFFPQNIRFHPALPYWESPKERGGKFTLLGNYPAMLAVAHDPLGNFVQIHKTYLTADGHKADVPQVKKNGAGTGSNSFAVRMMEPMGDTLGISEGIETGIASAVLMNIPVWPCLNGQVMSAFQLPDYLKGQIRRLVIFKDNDPLRAMGRNPDGSPSMKSPGAFYAAQAANLARQQGLRPMLVTAAKVGMDMDDYLRSQVAA